MTIIYEDAQGLIKLQELLKLAPEDDMKVVVRQLKRESDDLNNEHLVSLLKGNFYDGYLLSFIVPVPLHLSVTLFFIIPPFSVSLSTFVCVSACLPV